jgi:hypothetical protein
MLVLVSLLLCARELAQPTVNPSGLRDGFEDIVGVMKTRAAGEALEAMFQFMLKCQTQATGLVGCGARANSRSPCSVRAPCARVLRTPLELWKHKRQVQHLKPCFNSNV